MKPTNYKMKKETHVGAICGGVVSLSKFLSDPWAYMMAYVMDDSIFWSYKKLRQSKDKEDQRVADKLFDDYARSAIWTQLTTK